MSTIVLWVSDLKKSAEYYNDLFAAESYYLTDGFASVSGSGNEVLLHEVPEEFSGQASIGEENPIKPVFSVSCIDLARQVATKHNCSFKLDSMEHNGKHYLDGLDPDGHVIQIVS